MASRFTYRHTGFNSQKGEDFILCVDGRQIVRVVREPGPIPTWYFALDWMKLPGRVNVREFDRAILTFKVLYLVAEKADQLSLLE